ncbi:MAG: hypothetical protein ACYDDZ_01725 [Acidimicrobiales bacterium]
MEDASIEQHLWDGRRLIGRLRLQRALGVIWLIDAGLQAESAKFDHDYPLGTLAQSVMGEPNWISRSIFAGIHPFVAHWPLWNLGAVLIQPVIGICLVTGRCTKGALGVSIIWALVIWWLDEGFGAPLMSSPTRGGRPSASLPGSTRVVYGCSPSASVRSTTTGRLDPRVHCGGHRFRISTAHHPLVLVRTLQFDPYATRSVTVDSREDLLVAPPDRSHLDSPIDPSASLEPDEVRRLVGIVNHLGAADSRKRRSEVPTNGLDLFRSGEVEHQFITVYHQIRQLGLLATDRLVVIATSLASTKFAGPCAITATATATASQ